MSSWSMDLLKVSLIGDKKEIVEILNVIMKNRGIFNFLTIDDTFDKMMEVIRTLNSSHLKREDFYERPYYDYPDGQLSDGVITQEEYDEWVNELLEERDFSEVYIDNIVIQSNGDYILQISDNNTTNPDTYTWEDIINELGSIKGCVIDNITEDDYKGYFISEYYNSTKIIKKENGNLHIDIYPHQNFGRLMDGNVYPIHLGLMLYQELLDDVDWCNFLLGDVSPKPQGEELDRLLKEKIEKECNLNSHKEKLSQISRVRNDENLIDTLKRMEYVE